MKSSIAIVGAGLSGLTIANRLSAHADVTVFEKARGVGGRMSTRNADPFYFDHGAQFFTARHNSFKQFLAPHISSGLVQEWQGKFVTLEKGKKKTEQMEFEPRYVATPGMNHLCKTLTQNIKINLNCEIAPLENRLPNGWKLYDSNGNALGNYDWVISTAPPIQTCRLFDKFLPQHSRLRQSKFWGCYSLMFGFYKTWADSWVGAKILNSPLDWIAINSTKPERNPNLTTLVVHANNIWSDAHIDDDHQATELFLRNELQEILEFDTRNPGYFSLHRWRYALLDKSEDDKKTNQPYCDHDLQLASAGDWCGGSRIEDTWLQSRELAEKIFDRATF